MKTRICIKLNAGNDRNGNPRRCYVVLDSDGIVDVIDEGYRGDGALKVAGFGTLQVQAEFRTTPAEYRATLKAGGHTRRVSIAAKLAETVEFAVNDAVRYGGASKGRK